MTPFHALQQVVKPALENTFGVAMAANIIMVARNKSGVPVVGMSKEDFNRLVEEICADERVVAMWGQAGTKERLARWKKSVE